MENMKVVDERNLIDTATHGITRFSDLTEDEFLAGFTNPNLSYELDSTNATYTEEAIDGSSYNKDWSGKYTTSINVSLNY